ncbi:hypothetical protein PsYK624_062380 [Phanerochaete sordida]|uniref:Uncharacterized protein n=1 Tax=Phanerochaete sordida TaxID=48140 RepID=A0A9P3LCC9_9APHY|nr:hypothetical protein PsYK624_062380 [Phanerochaete sordida]
MGCLLIHDSPIHRIPVCLQTSNRSLDASVSRRSSPLSTVLPFCTLIPSAVSQHPASLQEASSPMLHTAKTPLIQRSRPRTL